MIFLGFAAFMLTVIALVVLVVFGAPIVTALHARWVKWLESKGLDVENWK